MYSMCKKRVFFGNLGHVYAMYIFVERMRTSLVVRASDCQRGGSPSSDEGHTLWYSLYVRTLWSAGAVHWTVSKFKNLLPLSLKGAQA
jgi:hypothetical protein